ncbi:calcium/calmodulin-dependent protein kinase type 1D-like [Planoprotostelium fungivorum]|uniref:non-specific serine/threonine protein kinase n=1 Tax=Planoprotostelium fungivorum TaxID=1890364 RepID=A0A2P6MNA4_9EUKA|nr:calcium/calmodulin-dependent protein kinase type 1D-like [Planoprotostelium fungivorum]
MEDFVLRKRIRSIPTFNSCVILIVHVNMSAPPRNAPPPPPPRASGQILTSNDAEEVAEQVEHEETIVEEEPEVPTEVYYGQTLEGERVGPGKYRWYLLYIDGTEDDLIDVKISRRVHAATANIYVNNPLTEDFPTVDKFDWNPTKGPLLGPAGWYRISVFGVPSFIEKDDMYLVDPSANWSTFDLVIDYSTLDEEHKERLRVVSDQYKREKPSSIWAQGYSQQFLSKYEEQGQSAQNELEEKMRNLELEKKIDIDVTALSSKYDIAEVIASSNDFSVVRRAREKGSGIDVAVKLIDKLRAENDAGLTADILKRQVEVLSTVSHPNVAKLLYHLETPKILALVLELSEGGAVDHWMGNRANHDESQARNIVSQVLSALSYLHSNSIIHKSVLPDNIVLSADGKVAKLVGFTLSEKNSTQEQSISGGHPSYQAPEMINRQPIGNSVDIWALGCVTYFLLCGYAPFEDTNNMRLNAKIRQGNYQFNGEDWSSVSAEGQQFVRSLLVVDANARPTAQAALSHPWLKSTSAAALPRISANIKSRLSH